MKWKMWEQNSPQSEWGDKLDQKPVVYLPGSFSGYWDTQYLIRLILYKESVKDAFLLQTVFWRFAGHSLRNGKGAISSVDSSPRVLQVLYMLSYMILTNLVSLTQKPEAVKLKSTEIHPASLSSPHSEHCAAVNVHFMKTMALKSTCFSSGRIVTESQLSRLSQRGMENFHHRLVLWHAVERERTNGSALCGDYF